MIQKQLKNLQHFFLNMLLVNPAFYFAENQNPLIENLCENVFETI